MCCKGITKCLFYLFNVVVWICGAASLGVGIWLQVDKSVGDAFEIAGITIYVAGTGVLIAGGAFMFIVGGIGCCGAKHKSKCLYSLYIVCLVIILALELGIGIWAVTEFDSTDELIGNSLNESIAQNKSLLNTQQNLECCGTNYGNSSVDGCLSYPNGVAQYCGCDPNTVSNPSNCVLVTNLTECTSSDSTDEYIYLQGCDQVLSDFIYDNFTYIAIVGIAIGLIEIFGMIISFCLCCSDD